MMCKSISSLSELLLQLLHSFGYVTKRGIEIEVRTHAAEKVSP